MTREIKFRAWDKVEGHYWNDLLNIGIAGRPEFDCSDEYFDDDEFIIEQYTGLKDKNGKEIYEGDVVKFLFFRKERIGQVVFDFVEDSEGYYIEKHYGWGIYRDYFNTSLGDYADDNMKCEDVEVIGTIHENLDLLKGEKQ